MAWIAYDSFKVAQYSGAAVDFSGGDTLKFMLLKSSYVPDQAADAFIDPDVLPSGSSDEVSGTNYTAGGATVSGHSVAVASHVLTFDCDDFTFLADAGGFTDARIAVLYKDTGDPTTSPVIAYYNLGSDRGNVGFDLVLGTPSGIFTT